MWTRALTAILFCTASPSLLTAQEAVPASAIDWLSESLDTPEPPKEVEERLQGVVFTPIEAIALDDLSRDGVGLVSATAAGLPSSAVAASDARRVADLLDSLVMPSVPVLAEFTAGLLVAELTPPRLADPTARDVFFNARIDLLLRLGHLEQAQALMERAGPQDRDVFRRWFDVSLLTGRDARACAALVANPEIAPTLPARAFCLSRSGDWAAAVLTLDAGRALGDISAEDAGLLGHFLDPEFYEGAPLPAENAAITPLRFRLLDGIGLRPDTRSLPVAFAAADLSPTVGWKARLEAAERLSRTGAFNVETLLSLYTERQPAASGGVWDRAAAVQAFDLALLAGDPAAVSAALPRVWREMDRAGLDCVLAKLYGNRLNRIPLPGDAQALALRMELLSEAFAEAPKRLQDDTTILLSPELSFALNIAKGDLGQRPSETLEAAIWDGLKATTMPARFAYMLDQGRLYESLLMILHALEAGPESDPQDIAEALTALRLAGFETLAQRTSLQLLLRQG